MPEVGKVEYAPDYKSKSQVRRIAAQQGNTLTRTDALIKEINERQRLERELIEAAKIWRRAQGEACDVAEVDAISPTIVRAWAKLRKVVDALIEFESSQQVKS